MTDNKEFIALHNEHNSLVIEFSPTEAPPWRYWGKRLDYWDTASMHARRSGRAGKTNIIDFDQTFGTCNGHGMGWFSSPSLSVHRAGLDACVQFTQARAAYDVPDNALRFDLVDEVARVEVQQHIHLDKATGVLSMRSVLTNRDNTVNGELLDVQWFAAATLPLNARCSTVQSYKGQWANEFVVCHGDLSQGTWCSDSRRGRNGHDQFLGSVVMLPGIDLHQGLAYGAHLAWSGNHTQLIECLPDGDVQWQWASGWHRGRCVCCLASSWLPLR
jgi:alpha-galactosidase